MVDFYGKCRWIYHTWILWESGWDLFVNVSTLFQCGIFSGSSRLFFGGVNDRISEFWIPQQKGLRWKRWKRTKNNTYPYIYIYPYIWLIFTYIWQTHLVNVGKYTIHWAFGVVSPTICTPQQIELSGFTPNTIRDIRPNPRGFIQNFKNP